VARELRRSGVAFDEVRVPMRRAGRDEVERVSGQRVVPLLVIEGEPICDSRRIVEHLRLRATVTHPVSPR
jgi:glutathione S-transferase